MAGRNIRIKRTITPLIRRFLEIMNLEGVHGQKLAQLAGISDDTIYRWSDGRDPRLNSFVCAVEAMGYEIVLVKKDATKTQVLRAARLKMLVEDSHKA